VTAARAVSSNRRGRMSCAATGASQEARDNGKPAERLGRKAPRLPRCSRHASRAAERSFLGDAP
jgi:hypothetical protein